MFRVLTVSGYNHGLGTDYRRNPRHHCMLLYPSHNPAVYSTLTPQYNVHCTLCVLSTQQDIIIKIENHLNYFFSFIPKVHVHVSSVGLAPGRYFEDPGSNPTGVNRKIYNFLYTYTVHCTLYTLCTLKMSKYISWLKENIKKMKFLKFVQNIPIGCIVRPIKFT